MTLESTQTTTSSTTDESTTDACPQTESGASATLTKKNDSPKACIEGCLFDGKPNARHKSYVHCSICFHLFHHECVSLTDKPTSWTCCHCRRLPAEVNQLRDLVSALVNQNAVLTQTVTQLQNSLEPLKCIETRLTAIHSKMFPDGDDSDDDDDDDTIVQPSGTLLIGDSLLRDVVATDDSLTVDSTGGANVSAIRK